MVVPFHINILLFYFLHIMLNISKEEPFGLAFFFFYKK